jgi:hypothetical protein
VPYLTETCTTSDTSLPTWYRTLGTAARLDKEVSPDQVLASFQALTPEQQAILIARLHTTDGSAAGPAPAAPAADKAPAASGKGKK